jgi:prepilin-type N-terminal cleavage/methylation domain-containing protein/prepilin-type processing-associated H-X9-DG protein
MKGQRIELRGFTLVELLVVIAIIGLLVGLLLTAIQAAREAARRTQCVNNLRQWGIAIQLHHDARQHYPPGRISRTQVGVCWAFQLLPFVEELPVFQAWQPNARVDSTENATAMRTPVPICFCPSRRTAVADRDFDNNDQPPLVRGVAAGGDYAANAGVSPRNGFHPETGDPQPLNRVEFGPVYTYSQIRSRHVTDGLSKTFCVGEKYIPKSPATLAGSQAADQAHYYLGDTAFFAADYPLAILRGSGSGFPTAVTDPLDLERFGSAHAGTTQFVFLDGHVSGLPSDIDLSLYRALSTIGDGRAVE